jgi:hypothetical protein
MLEGGGRLTAEKIKVGSNAKSHKPTHRFETNHPKVDTDNEGLAHSILGRDFLSLKEVAEVRGLTYSDEQRAALAEAMPDAKKLEWLRDNEYILSAPPSSDLNLLAVRAIGKQLFYCQSAGWFADCRQDFSRDDVVKAGEWLMMSKKEYSNSYKKVWSDQQNLLAESERVPNAAEVAYIVTTYYMVRGVSLLTDVLVRTSSVDVDGHCVIIGDFRGKDLDVLDYLNNRCSEDVGILSTRK